MVETRINEIMSRGLITCSPQASVADVARLLHDAEVSAVIVLANKEVQGVISQFDFLQHYGKDISNLKASEVMSSNPITIVQDGTVSEAIALMLEHRIHRLVVIKNSKGKQVAGVISISDIIQIMRSSASQDKDFSSLIDYSPWL